MMYFKLKFCLIQLPLKLSLIGKFFLALPQISISADVWNFYHV